MLRITQRNLKSLGEYSFRFTASAVWNITASQSRNLNLSYSLPLQIPAKIFPLSSKLFRRINVITSRAPRETSAYGWVVECGSREILREGGEEGGGGGRRGGERER